MNNVLLNTAFSGTIASGVELMEDIVLYGQRYSKTTLAPRPLQFLPMPSLYNEFFADKMLFWTQCSTYYDLGIDNNLIIDSNDSTISYMFRQVPNNKSIVPVLVRIKTNKDKTQDVTEAPLPFGTADRPIVHFLDQDSKYLYASLQYGAAHTRIVRLPKDMSAGNGTAQVSDWKGNLLIDRVDATTIRFFAQIPGSAQYSLNYIEYTKGTTGALKNVARLGAEGHGQLTTSPTAWFTPKIGDRAYTIGEDPGSNGLIGLKSFRYDVESNSIKIEPVKLTIQTDERSAFTKSGISYNIVHDPRVIIDGDTTYIVVITRLNTDQHLSTDMTYPKIYVFELTSPQEATLRQTIKLDRWYYGCLAINNGKTLLCVHSSGVHIYTWDAADKLLALVHDVAIAIYQIAVDKMNTLYIVEAGSKTVYRLSQGVPAGRAIVNFDKSEYSIDSGDKITSKISVHLKNYMGNYLGRNVKVVLFGNCTFEDGTKETVVATSPEGPVEKKIIITGIGELNAIPELI